MEPVHMAILAVLIGLLVWFAMTMTNKTNPSPAPIPTSNNNELAKVLLELDDVVSDFDAIEAEDEEAFTSLRCDEMSFDEKLQAIQGLHDRAIGIIEGIAIGTIGVTVDSLVAARTLFKQVRYVIQCARDEIRSDKNKGNRPNMRKALKAVARVAKNKAKRSRNMIRRRLNEQTPGWRTAMDP